MNVSIGQSVARSPVAVVAIFLGLAFGESTQAQSIEWRGDLEGAKLAAKGSGRLVWVQLTGPWCYYCTLMEKETFTDRRVIETARDSFLTVKLRADENEELTLRHGFQAIPATLILDSDGNVVDKFQGYTDADTFAAFLAKKVEEAESRRSSVDLSSTVPTKNESVGLRGFSPVSLVDDHRLGIGAPAISLTFEGTAYWFQTQNEAERFRRDSRRYAPLNRGFCPVAAVDRGESKPGNPRFGVFVKGHLYLFATNEARQTFRKNPNRYVRVALAEQRLCVHCWSVDKLAEASKGYVRR